MNKGLPAEPTRNVQSSASSLEYAVTRLEMDFQSRNATMPGLLYMPPLDSLRDDPALQGFIAAHWFAGIEVRGMSKELAADTTLWHYPL